MTNSAAEVVSNNPNVFRQLSLYVEADSPEVYGLHDFIESVIGGSATKSDFKGTIRIIADAGRLGDFVFVVDKFEKALKDITDEDDKLMFPQLLSEARDAIRVMQEVMTNPLPNPKEAVLRIADNTWTAAADLHNQQLRQAS